MEKDKNKFLRDETINVRNIPDSALTPEELLIKKQDISNVEDVDAEEIEEVDVEVTRGEFDPDLDEESLHEEVEIDDDLRRGGVERMRPRTGVPDYLRRPQSTVKKSDIKK